MSILYGAFYRQGHPVNPDLWNRLNLAAQAFPHQQTNHVTRGNIALGLVLTPHSGAVAEMPCFLNEQNLLFCAKGRIDNKQDLINQLGLDSSSSDSQLMMQAYLRWGYKVADHLLGDWLLLAFHIDSQTLFIASDHHGYTALHYYIDQNVILFSSNIRLLLALKEVPQRLNMDKFITHMLCWHGGAMDPEAGQTFYQDIQLLPAAHQMQITATNINIKRHWRPETIARNYNATPSECAEHLLELINLTIQSRLDSGGAVCSMLSGGLDSSTVSYLAAEKLAKAGKPLTTLSHVPAYTPSAMIDGKRIGDERPNIEAIVSASGNIAPLFIDSANVSPLEGIQQILDICQAPIHAAVNAYWLYDLGRIAAQQGASTLLTGEMGNATISMVGLYHQLPWQTLRESRGIPFAIKHKVLAPTYTSVLNPLLRRRSIPAKHWTENTYLKFPLPSTFNAASRIRHSPLVPGLPTLFSDIQSKILAIMQIGSHPRGVIGSHIGDHFGIQYSDPTADRRVFESVLAFPNACFFSEDGRQKNLVKQMMQSKLPEQVLHAKLKGLQSADIGARVLRHQQEIDLAITHLWSSPTAKELLDLQQLSDDWKTIQATTENYFNTSRIHFVLRAVMMGLFLQRFD